MEYKTCCVCHKGDKRLDVTCLKCFRAISEDLYWRLIPSKVDSDEALSVVLCNRHRADKNPRYEKVSKTNEEWVSCHRCHKIAHKVVYS